MATTSQPTADQPRQSPAAPVTATGPGNAALSGLSRTIAVTACRRSRFSRLKVRHPETADHPSYDLALARELLARTADLPSTKRDLIAVLTEYRHALHALAAETRPRTATTR